MKARTIILLAALGLILIAAAVFRVLITRSVDGDLSFAFPESQYVMYRLVPLVAALIVGAGLGVSGMGLQVLLRNPLASPWILGLSSGAGLGVMATMYAEHTIGSPIMGGQSIGAVLGAFVSLLLVYALSRRSGGIDPMSMVLVGVVISVLCGSGIMIFQHLVPMGLRDLDLHFIGVGEIPDGHTEPPRGHLLDRRALGVSIGQWLEALRILAAFAGVALAADAVHRDGQPLVGLGGDGTEAHRAGAEALDDFAVVLHLVDGNRPAVRALLERPQPAQQIGRAHLLTPFTA